MSDTTYQPKTYRRNNGDTFTVDSGGTIQALSGGSVVVASGGRVEVLSGGSAVVNSGGRVEVLSGGTIEVNSGGRIEVASGGTLMFGASALGAVSYGSAVLTDGGSATVGVGFAIRGVAPIIVGVDGSISGVAVNTSLYSSGSAILYGMAGTLATTLRRGTVGYTIFG